MDIEGEVERRGLLTRVRVRLCEDGIVRSVFKKDYRTKDINQQKVINDMTNVFGKYARVLSYSSLMTSVSTVAFAGDGGSDLASVATLVRAISMAVHKLIEMF